MLEYQTLRNKKLNGSSGYDTPLESGKDLILLVKPYLQVRICGRAWFAMRHMNGNCEVL